MPKDEPEGDAPENEKAYDPGAFPGQNPGRLVVLPVDTLGVEDFQGHIEGRSLQAQG